MVGKKLYLPPLLKNGYLQMSLELKQRMGKFSLLYANQFSLVECNGIMQEATSRNIKGSALKSICFFEKVLHTFINVDLPVM